MKPSAVPSDIVQDILFEACATFPCSPPFPPTAFAMTCRALRDHVEPCLDGFLARLLGFHFDRPQPIGRDTKLETPQLADEMRSRMRALYSIEARRLFAAEYDPSLRLSVLSTVYLMILEDTGMNAAHLYRTTFVHDAVAFVCQGLLEGDKGWPESSPMNAVLFAVLARLLRRDDIKVANIDLRRSLLTKINPVALAQFRYPVSLSLAPTPDAPMVGSQVALTHYGRVVPMILPPIAVSAAQILFAHWDACPPEIPFGLHPDRASAVAAYGPVNVCPTRADLHEVRARMSERFSALGLHPACAWEADWRRSMTRALPRGEQPCAYKLGSMSGAWAGSSLLPCSIAYDRMKTSGSPPEHDIIICSPSSFVTFREYIRRSDAPPLEPLAGDDGWRHAWLPHNFFSRKKGDAIDDPRAPWRAFYNEVDVASLASDDTSCWDPTRHVVFVGKTEERHAQAWGSFEWVGTVRQSDGQIVLLRRSINMPGADTKVVVGYLIGGRQLVAHIMDTLDGYAPADFAAPFSITRVTSSPSAR